jgi:Skp family chaperone for outer membrane proteins
VKRVYVCLSAFAAAARCAVAGTLSAQAPAGGGAAAPAANPAPPSRGTAVFNVAKVMKDFQKWQYFAAQMNKERAGQAAALTASREQILKLEQEIRTETVQATKTQKEQQLVALQRQYEDKERAVRKDIDDKSAAHLRVLFGEIRNVVEAVAKTNGFELVLAYPDAITPEEMNSPLYFDLKLRPPAAMPFYVSPSVDITGVVVATLNKHYGAPGPIDPGTPGVSPAGAPPGTAAGTQPAGTPPPMK